MGRSEFRARILVCQYGWSPLHRIRATGGFPSRLRGISTRWAGSREPDTPSRPFGPVYHPQAREVRAGVPSVRVRVANHRLPPFLRVRTEHFHFHRVVGAYFPLIGPKTESGWRSSLSTPPTGLNGFDCNVPGDTVTGGSRERGFTVGRAALTAPAAPTSSSSTRRRTNSSPGMRWSSPMAADGRRSGKRTHWWTEVHERGKGLLTDLPVWEECHRPRLARPYFVASPLSIRAVTGSERRRCPQSFIDRGVVVA